MWIQYDATVWEMFEVSTGASLGAGVFLLSGHGLRDSSRSAYAVLFGAFIFGLLVLARWSMSSNWYRGPEIPWPLMLTVELVVLAAVWTLIVYSLQSQPREN